MNKLLFLIITLFALFGCTTEDINTITLSNGETIYFHEVGYFKDADNMRVMTFYVYSSDTINPSMVKQIHLDAFKKHGKQQMNTEGATTVSCYYTHKEVPIVTQSNTFNEAINFAFKHKVDAAYFRYADGSEKFIVKPE